MKHKLLKPLKISSLLIIAFLTLYSCKSDDENTPEEMEEDEQDLYKTSGYVLSSQSTGSDGTTIFSGYSENKPSGNIDFTSFSSSDRFRITAQSGNFLYGRPFDNGNRLTKFAVNAETEKIEEIGFITTSGGLQQTNIIRDDLGFYTVSGENALYLFNPETMESIRTITLTGAVGPTIANWTTYIQAVYRPQDNKVFLFSLINDPNTGAFYDADSIYAEVISLDTFSLESTAILENAQYPLNRGVNQNLAIDESGNIFVTCQGSYGLDGQAGPTAAIGSRPQIAKIPAGSNSFDETYRFNPVNALGFESLIAQFFTGFIYDANGIGYAAVSAAPDSDKILELVTKRFLGTISTEEVAELSDLVLNSPTSKWAKLDLNTQTATVIDGMPFISGFIYAFSTKIDDKLYFQTVNIEQDVNSLYEYDPLTGNSTEAFGVAAGGFSGPFFKLVE